MSLYLTLINKMN